MWTKDVDSTSRQAQAERTEPYSFALSLSARAQQAVRKHFRLESGLLAYWGGGVKDYVLSRP